MTKIIDKTDVYSHFSIVIPAYNAAEFIVQTLNSIIDRIPSTLEIVVVNDGSTDRTLQLLDKFGKRIRLINQDNFGESVAVNNGIMATTRNYIMVLSADDLIINESIFEESYKIFENEPICVAVYPDWNIIDTENQILEEIYTKNYNQKIMIMESFCIPGPGTVFRKDQAIEIGLRNKKYKYVGDFDFWIRLSTKGYFRRFPLICASWRKHDNSTSVNSKNLKMALERIEVIEDNLDKFNLSDKEINSAKARAFYQAALLSYFSYEVPGKDLFKNAIKYDKKIVLKIKITHTLFLLLFPISLNLKNSLIQYKLMKRLFPN